MISLSPWQATFPKRPLSSSMLSTPPPPPPLPARSSFPARTWNPLPSSLGWRPPQPSWWQLNCCSVGWTGTLPACWRIMTVSGLRYSKVLWIWLAYWYKHFVRCLECVCMYVSAWLVCTKCVCVCVTSTGSVCVAYLWTIWSGFALFFPGRWVSTMFHRWWKL